MVVLLALLAVPAAGQAQYYYSNYYYTVNSASTNTITITKYTGPGGAVTIPSSINGLTVTSVGYWTQTNIIERKTNIVEVGAFNSSSLSSIIIPDSVTSIGNDVFDLCTNLTNVTLPSGVTNIGNYAFLYCIGLTNFTMPGSLANLGTFAFWDCFTLHTVTFSGAVTNIGEDAFDYCSTLSGIYFQGNAPAGGNAFYEDNNATVYYLPGTTGWGSTFGGLPTAPFNFVFTIQNGTIIVTGYLGPGGAVSIPGTINGLPVTGLGAATPAYDYTNATSVTIPNSVTSIGVDAFFCCTNLASVTIPNSVTSIGSGAFADCTSLTSVTIPGSVTSIADVTFFGCNQLTNVVILNGVTSIGVEAFDECGHLTSITIPMSLTNIGASAFNFCAVLGSIYCAGNAPAASASAFLADYRATIYYLAGTTGWSAFSAITGRPAVLWNPQIQPQNGNFGISNNQFGFNITGGTNTFAVVVQACTNLANPIWTPLATNTLAHGSFYFSDPQWTNYPNRFYSLAMP